MTDKDQIESNAVIRHYEQTISGLCLAMRPHVADLIGDARVVGDWCVVDPSRVPIGSMVRITQGDEDPQTDGLRMFSAYSPTTGAFTVDFDGINTTYRPNDAVVWMNIDAAIVAIARQNWNAMR